MSDKSPKKLVEYDRLNALGKIIYLTGAGVDICSYILEKTIDRASEIIQDTQAAFQEALDPGIQDAKIIEEKEDGKEKSGK